MGKPEGRKPLDRQRHAWMDSIKVDVGDVEWGSTDCIGLVKDRDNWRAHVSAVKNFWFP
jgi:hypothetical protein